MDAERGETKPCPKCGESKPRNGYRYCDACVDAALSDTEGGLMGDERFDPDKTWGEGGWLRHEGCPVAVLAGQRWAMHSKAFHGRPLRAAALNKEEGLMGETPDEFQPPAVLPITVGEMREMCEGLPDSALIYVMVPDSGSEDWRSVEFDISAHLSPYPRSLVIEVPNAF